MSRNDKVYSATYSNVPVYEYTVEANHVMRRRADDWINATHILKVAEYDKPARTRILEREVQKGVHEKIQGGYGKYQGTWIPLPDGRDLAAKNGVLEKLQAIFDFVPGDKSPPPAPKHVTASSKPRATRAPAQPRRQPGKKRNDPPAQRGSDINTAYGRTQDHDQMDISMQDAGTPDNEAASESAYDDYEGSQYGGSHKRRRLEDSMTEAEKDHQLWADELLDYFMLEDSPDSLPTPPLPPANANLDLAIDDKGHTALHWAAAMGDVKVVKYLLNEGANPDVHAHTGETPLMRAIIFTNNFDRQIMDKIAGMLIHTVSSRERSGATVLHQIAHTTVRRSRYACAQYYMGAILDQMWQKLRPQDMEDVLNMVDHFGDTAMLIAARNGARSCVRALLGRNADVTIKNEQGETAETYIIQLNQRKQERAKRNQVSSSPFNGDGSHGPSASGGAVQSFTNGLNGSAAVDHVLAGSSSNENGINAHGVQGDFQSESALSLTSAVVPNIIKKTTSLAAGLDADAAEKQAELTEAERLVEMRRIELSTMHAQAEDLRTLEQAKSLNQADEALLGELRELTAECEKIAEQDQALSLEELITEEKEKEKEGADYHSEDFMEDDQAVISELARLTEQRQVLLQDLVQRMSDAGTGDKQSMYKRLVTEALDLRERDIEGMLPEILAELEDHQALEAGG